ncbi:DUF4402 domain-containing protein [Salinimicrobium sp. HB62]|uniref:DUF4402 domain-containing protein n=1 Tax=Salinimicrobium sp. HB62 TaxID=3077781 RepID=UPI002D794718|nr:DUF4402 domain-containing protein [Salinimicrobium sp. HB62]
MKKITFVLIALFTGTAFGQEEANATANVNAEIVSPITIVSDGTALDFGTINGTATGGDVSVDINGNRTFTNTAMKVTSAVTPSAATFKITAANEYLYSISIPDITLTGDGSPMNVSFVHNRNSTTGKTGSGSQQPLYVGGTLTVNDNQTAGSYTGEVEVTVAYE